MGRLTTVQDNARENKLRILCGLHESGEGRHGVDAVDEDGIEFELKSGTKDYGFSTSRLVGLHTLERWKTRHWIFAHGDNFDTGFVIKEIYYVSADKMQDWMNSIRERLTYHAELGVEVMKAFKDFGADTSRETAKLIKSIWKRGSSFNDPKVSLTYVRARGTVLTEPYAMALREAMTGVERPAHMNGPLMAALQ